MLQAWKPIESARAVFSISRRCCRPARRTTRPSATCSTCLARTIRMSRRCKWHLLRSYRSRCVANQSSLSPRKVLDLYSTATLSQIEKLQSIAAISYRDGAWSLFELLDAQRAHNTAMTAYNQARFDYQMAIWQLEQATGSSLQ